MRKTLSGRLSSSVLALACGTFAAALAAAAAHALLGEPAPDFALKAAGGDNVRLSEHRGDVVVVSFWGSRCAPCADQLAALDRSLATYRSAGLKMFGIGVDDDAEHAAEFAEDRALSFPLLLDPTKGASRAYQVDNLPMTVLIDRSGVVRHVYRDRSAKSEALYLRELRELLNE